MKKLACLPLILLFLSGLAFAQSKQIPTCNNFDATGKPVYVTTALVNGVTTITSSTPNCTDFFGPANWANSPLPAGTIANFTLVTAGSGYANPVVVITDPTGTGATATATVTQGLINGVGLVTGGSNYVIPQVSIVDVGVGGTLAAPTCGGAAQPACGKGALATATIGPPFSGGMKKFQDLLVDLKSTIATPDTLTFPGADYYEIALVQYQQKMHSSLPPTTLRGYVQMPTGSVGCPVNPAPKYLGPVIVAQKNRPVRVKFMNCLPTGTAGQLFIPMDSTYMGAGMGPGGNVYTENRATLHLHGGATPWISDGTPHQWTVPVGEATLLQTGDSVAYVPDMFFDATGKITPVPQCSATVTTNCWPNAIPAGLSNKPGEGGLTFYWTNQQGGRLMFYHDHAYGLTRLNVYVGEAAGYLLWDPAEEAALQAAGVPGTITAGDFQHLIPLVIQDKTFVPPAAQLHFQDPTWDGNFGATPVTANGSNGDLWFSHVYPTNQNPADPSGGNAFGRWDYGAWFWPVQTTLTAAVPTTAVTIPCTSAAFPGQIIANTGTCATCGCPIIPNPSGTPETFLDTPVVNGVAYPVLHVSPAAYRFKILAAGNDRSWALSWFVADPLQGNTEVAMLPASMPTPATSVPPPVLPLCQQINPIAVPSLVVGQVTALFDATGEPLNGTGLPLNCWPNYGGALGIPKIQTMWLANGNGAGAPDPRTAGPPWIQIGTEGGLLPQPVVIPATPTNYEFNPRSITITNVGAHGLWLGPAERADVIVDFTKFAGKTLILYNDAPAPAPAFDMRLDYWTGSPDQSLIGGSPTTQPGYGPNTRTIMQVIVDPTAGANANAVPFTVSKLNAAFQPVGATPSLFAQTQPTIIIPESAYSQAYNTTFADTLPGIHATDVTFTPIVPLAPTGLNLCANQPVPPAVCVTMERTAIQELFTPDYGRMNATLGVEIPLTTFLVQTTIPYDYIDPPTDIMKQGDTRVWKLTHNGVDTHFIHFHLFNLQVITRLGWDGSVRPPDPNEMGWKETVRMNPLEDIVLALQPITPTLPWPLPDSLRLMDVTNAPGTTAQFTGVDPYNNPITVSNAVINYGWEYVWHCHILGHEENDMMRPILWQVPPPAPINLQATAPTGATTGAVVAWTDTSASEDSFTLQRDLVPTFNSASLASWTITAATAGVTGFNTLAYNTAVTFPDTTAAANTAYFYRVQACDSFTPSSPLAPPFRAVPMCSPWSGTSAINAAPITPTVTFTGAPASAAVNSSFVVTATTNASSVPTITGTAGICTVGPVAGTAASATATVTMTGLGSCVMTASWAADLYFAAATATQTTSAFVLPTIVWPTPLPIVYGTALSATQLNASAQYPLGTAIPGTYVYTPAAGTVLPVGIKTLSVTFTPTDLVTYRAATGTVTITVTGAPLTITASSAAMTYGGAVPVITPTYTGFVNADTVATAVTVAPVCTTVATNASPASPPTYQSSCSGAVAPNYVITYVAGAVTVNKATSTTTITSNLPNPAIVGQLVTVGFSVAPQFLGTPTGTVTVTASTGETCTGALAGGAGTCTIVFYTGGAKTLTATYSGDNNFLTSTSAPVTESISTIQLSSTSLLFGNQALNSTSPSQSVNIINVSAAAATINSIAITGANPTDFAWTNNNCAIPGSLGVGRGCSINVTFRPTALGVRTATLTITDSSIPSPQSVTLTGTGVQATGTLLPTTYNFGAVALNVTSAPATFTLTSTGTALLIINGVTLNPGPNNEFAMTSNTCVNGTGLAPGQTCTMTVTFTPNGGSPNPPQLITSTLSVSTNASPAIPAATLTGSVAQPVATVSPLSLSFGTVAVNTVSAPQTVTLTNTGTSTLTMQPVQLGGTNPTAFPISSNTCGTSLAANASCAVVLTFNPTAVQAYSASLRFSTNGGNRTVPLSGTGQ